MIVSLDKGDSPRIAQIHKEALAGDFLPSLGINFLEVFYEGVLKRPGIYAFGWKEKDGVVGFVLGAKDSGRFFKDAIKSQFFRLFLLASLQIIRRPIIVKKIIETFLYPNKDVGPKAELVVIAVSKKHQGSGIGKKLVTALEGAFKNTKIKEYKLTVHADKKAVGFYEHLGYFRISSFKLYDKMWYVYARKLNKRKNGQIPKERRK